MLSTTTLSGTSTTISSIDQTYNYLLIYVKNMNLSTSTNAYPQIEPNSVSNLTAYSNQIGTGGTIATQGDSTQTIVMSYDVYAASNTNNVMAIELFNYAATDSFKPYNLTGSFVNGSNNTSVLNSSGVYRSNTAISSLKFTTGSAASYNGGTVLIYGVK